MGEGSPLFNSSMELLAHAIEHYNAGTERDRRFMILHLANAVELLLKDVCLDLDESIYKNPKETKGIWQIIKDIQARTVTIPCLPVLELLIEERNNIQHRFGSENEVMANWYMEKTLEFFEDYMNSHFNLDLREHLSNFVDEAALRRVLPSLAAADPFADAKKAAKVQPTGAVLTVWIEIERKLQHLRELLLASGEPEARTTRQVPMTFVLKRATRLIPEVDGQRLLDEYRDLQSERASIAHGRSEPTQATAVKLIGRMAEFIEKVDTLLERAAEPEAASAPDQSEPRDE